MLAFRLKLYIYCRQILQLFTRNSFIGVEEQFTIRLDVASREHEQGEGTSTETDPHCPPFQPNTLPIHRMMPNDEFS